MRPGGPCRDQACCVPEVTVNSVDEEIEFSDAEMVAVPAATALASPWLPDALLMVATDCVSEFQVTDVVTSCVELSENFPVAANC